MRRIVTTLLIVTVLGALCTVGVAWTTWLARPAETARALAPDVVLAVLDDEYGTIVEPFGTLGMERRGFGWRDTLATTGTAIGTRQVRIVESGWPRPCFRATERPRQESGFLTLPYVGNWTDSDGRVPVQPLWPGLLINVAAESGLLAVLAFGVPVAGRLVSRRGEKPTVADAPAGGHGYSPMPMRSPGTGNHASGNAADTMPNMPARDPAGAK